MLQRYKTAMYMDVVGKSMGAEGDTIGLHMTKVEKHFQSFLIIGGV